MEVSSETSDCVAYVHCMRTCLFKFIMTYTHENTMTSLLVDNAKSRCIVAFQPIVHFVHMRIQSLFKDKRCYDRWFQTPIKRQ